MNRLEPLVVAVVAAALAACSDGKNDTTPDAAVPQDVARNDADTGADTAAEDAQADVEVCETLGDKVIGAECTSHCECATGYCYDEAYLAPFRFCTRPCDGSCNTPGEGDTHVCLNLTSGKLDDKYDLKLTEICQRRCAHANDCADLSDQYDTCGVGGFTKWENHTIGGRSCQITSLIE